MSRKTRLTVDLSKLTANFQTLNARCLAAGVTLTPVLKAISAAPEVITALAKVGLNEVGASRWSDFAHWQKFSEIRRTVLRLPALSELDDILSHSDCSLNAQPEVMSALDAAATRRGITHEIILMVDCGDLREGFNISDLSMIGELCRGFNSLKVIGLGTNFSCFAGVRPDVAKLAELVKMADVLRREYDLPIKLVSGGNSSTLPLLYDHTLPSGINHLRVGEALLLGRETFSGTILPDLYDDVFVVEGEVLQSFFKSNVPDGEIGFNAFGRQVTLPEVANGFRSLLNFGVADTVIEGLTPLDEGITILGGSSDYTVIASERQLRVGEILRFRPNYWALLEMAKNNLLVPLA